MAQITLAMLAGGHREALIGEAVKSAIWLVDHITLLDTGTATEAIKVARALAGDTPVTVIPYDIGDEMNTADARNALLKGAAEESGCEWTLMLDTDERLVSPGATMGIPLSSEAIRAAREWCDLASSEAGRIEHVSGVYAKEKLFRLPAKGRYIGRAHEYYSLAGQSTSDVPVIKFWDHPRSPAEIRQRSKWLVTQMRRQCQEESITRWWMYLGMALDDSAAWCEEPELWPQAVTAYSMAAQSVGSLEEKAWALFLGAVVLAERLGKYQEALNFCVEGMNIHPTTVELMWYAGFCCYRLGRYVGAAYWARAALANADRWRDGRLTFRRIKAYSEGPRELLKWCGIQLKEDVPLLKDSAGTL